MAGSEGNSKSYDSSQMMLAELQNHLEEFRRSEQLGENRLTIYLTIVTAVLGGSGFLVYFQVQDGTSKLTQIDLRIIFLACLATLIFGVLTLLRMVHRNLISNEELRAANRIRMYFVERDRNILEYLQYTPNDDKPIREWKWKNGGLVDTVVLLNALLVAIIMATIVALMSLNCRSDSFIAFAGISGFLAAWTIQILFVKNEYGKARDEIKAFFPSRSPSHSK
jgi:hypothetical protein